MASKLTFLNHASFLVETGQTMLIVDPWLEGNAFNNGWALLDRTTSNQQLYDRIRAAAAKNVYVWYSHEHSDHFAVPFIKNLARQNLKATFLFQQTLDKRVVNFLTKAGHAVLECETGVTRRLEDQLDITVYPHSGGDSYFVIKTGDRVILNLNDCVIRSTEAAQAVKASLPESHRKVDILFTQFGYANWVGNEADVELRQEAAREKLDRVAHQVEVLNPAIVVPFASFVFFCDAENFYLNKEQNTPSILRKSPPLEKWQNRICFLQPHDEVSLLGGPALQEQFDALNGKAEEHWQNAFAGIAPLAAPQAAAVDGDVLLDGFRSFRKKLSLNFLFLPQLMELMGFVKPVNVLLTDSETVFRLSYLQSPAKLPGNSPWRMMMSSSTLEFVVKNEFGFNTTHVNGRFRLKSADDFYGILKFFILQDVYKNGYGLKNPYKSVMFFLQALKKALRRHPAAA